MSLDARDVLLQDIAFVSERFATRLRRPIGLRSWFVELRFFSIFRGSGYVLRLDPAGVVAALLASPRLLVLQIL